MSCKSQRPETLDQNDATRNARRDSTCACPCGDCPKKAKWVCLAGLAAGLGFVTFRALRQAMASS